MGVDQASRANNESARSLGRHMPLDGRPTAALRTAHEIGCEVVQIFVSNPRAWTPPPDRPDEIAELLTALDASELAPLVVHAAYLLNLASANPETRAKSIDLLIWTLQRSVALRASDVVMHIGSHGGDGLATGIERVIAGLRQVWQSVSAQALPRLLLENDVGAGNTIGSHWDSLAEVLQFLRPVWGDRLGICLDTAHLWGAGYDIGTPDAALAVLDTIDAALGSGSTTGLDLVKVIHLNDTATKLGGHRDVHARIGEGVIGMEGLQTLLQDARLTRAHIILETPIVTLPESDRHDWEDERQRIAAVRTRLFTAK